MIGTWLEEGLSSRAKAKVLRLLAEFPAQEDTGREEAPVGPVVEEIRRGLPPVLSCVLFGSVARGEERPGSDVDLLVVLRDPRAAEQKLAAPGLRASGRCSAA